MHAIKVEEAPVTFAQSPRPNRGEEVRVALLLDTGLQHQTAYTVSEYVKAGLLSEEETVALKQLLAKLRAGAAELAQVKETVSASPR